MSGSHRDEATGENSSTLVFTAREKVSWEPQGSHRFETRRQKNNSA